MQDINLMHTASVKWPVEFKNFHDLIYTKLDLPPPPVLDPDKFDWWCNKSEMFLKSLPSSQHVKKGKLEFNYTSAYHDNQNVRNEPFPYTMYPAMSRLTSLTDSPWIENFDKLFPEMIDYYHLFPGAKFRSLGFIKQNENMKVWDHTDADQWIGFRFYLRNNCKTDNLYFRKIKEEFYTGNRYTTYIDTGTKKHVRDFSKLLEEEKLYVKNNSGNYAWALTSTKATHGIDAASSDEERITGMIEFWPFDAPGIVDGFKIKETIDLFERSIKKFNQETIWYK